MINQLKQNRAEVLFLTSLLLFVLAPKFTAIDSVGIRWFLVSISALFYSVYCLILRPYTFRYEKYISVTLLVLIFASTISLLFTNNINESILSLSKILIIISTFYLSFNALLKMSFSNGIVISLFVSSLVIETIFTNSFFLIYGIDELKGISMNRNVSSFSMAFKLPLLLYLISKIESQWNLKLILLRLVEISTITSIILLQSRAAILCILLLYVVLLFIQKRKFFLKSNLFSLSALIGIFIILSFRSINLVSYKIENILNLVNDESLNQRIDYYTNAISLFIERPLFGNGIGSFKTESLKFYDNISTIPYYTHNDFLQLLSETGIFGFFSYTIFLTLILSLILNNFKQNQINIFLLGSILIFLINSLINFPFHRPQEIIPFIFLSAFILIIKKDSKYFKASSSFPINLIIVVTLIFSSILSFKQHQSLIKEDILITRFYSDPNQHNPNLNIDVDYKFPNLSSNTTPIATYLAKEFINQNEFERANRLIDYSLRVNPYLDITWKEKLTLFLKSNNLVGAFEVSKYLFEKNTNNDIYAEIFFSLSSALGKSEIFYQSSNYLESSNVKVHHFFFNEFSKIPSFNRSVFLGKLLNSIKMFPDDKLLMNYTKDFN